MTLAKEYRRRVAARTDLRQFISQVSPDTVPARHHHLLLDKLEALHRGDCRRLMVFMPPGHAKSTYASMLFPPWWLGCNPTKSLIAASHTQDLANRFGRRVRNMVRSQEFVSIFGHSVAGDSQAVDRWAMEAGGEYVAAGVGGAIAGYRADGAIIDDPVKSREDADSETVREKTWQWWLSDLRTRLKPGAWVMIIQTRWHEDDLSGRILPEGYAGESGLIEARDGEIWDVISLPALAEANDPLGRQEGAALWPEWMDQAALEVERGVQGSRNWSALYQQRPAPEEGNFFQRDWLRWYDEPPRHLECYGASDYAVTADGGDYTVHGVIGVDPEDNIYLLDWWRAQTTTDVWIEELLRLMRKHEPMMWAEEQGQIIKSVGPFIDKRQREERVYCFRKQLTSATDKPSRARSIQARMAMGKVYLPKRAPWVEKLVYEMMSFPAGTNDDQVDVLSLFGRVLNLLERGEEPPAPEKTKWPQERTFDQILDRHHQIINRDRERDSGLI
jgi:predicted phage terminase large subunit-like protein